MWTEGKANCVESWKGKRFKESLKKGVAGPVWAKEEIDDPRKKE